MALFFNNTLSTFHPSLMTTENTTEFESFPAAWVFGMISFGFLGIILIPLMCIHSVYNFRQQQIMAKPQRALYTLFFLLYLSTCIGYAFFRIDLILPMGTAISCKFGYYFTTNSLYLAKTSLFMIFLYRIDLAFHSSALGYPRKYLIIIASTYLFGISALNAGWIYVTWDIISFERAKYFNSLMIGICTTGSSKSKYGGSYSLILGLLFLGDMCYNLLLCILFVYKLNLVVKMSGGQSTTLHSKHDKKKDNKLKRIMKKQTILVLLACLTSMATLGVGAMIRGFSLMIPFDATFNTFCVWLMFSFSDPIWNKLVKYLCCCCYCCLIHMQSISKAWSLRSVTNINMNNDLSITTTTNTSTAKHIDIHFKNAKHIKLDKINSDKDNNENTKIEQNNVIVKPKTNTNSQPIELKPAPDSLNQIKSNGSDYSSINEDSDSIPVSHMLQDSTHL